MFKKYKTSEVSKKAIIGNGTIIWNDAQVREDAVIGKNCIIGKNVYIDFGVIIGNNVKIQNNSSIYHGVTIEDNVFVGPHVCTTNDVVPRSCGDNGLLKSNKDWQVGKTFIKYGSSIGANSVILPNVTIGNFAMVGAGSVVTKDVPDYALVYGNPVRLAGYVCYCGQKLNELMECPLCKKIIKIK